MNKLQRILLYVAIVISILALLYFGRLGNDKKSPLYSGASVVIIEPNNLTERIVYFSTAFFGQPLMDHVTSRTFVSPSLCREQYPKCLITSYKEHAAKADASITHWRDYMYTNASYLHAVDNSTRPSILMNFESPANSKHLPRDDRFHLVANYRRDSDIYVPYGKVTQLPVPTTEFMGIDFSFNKTLPAAWIVSNCNYSKGAANRMNYVLSLQNYIQVDIYGKCGTLKCDNQSNRNHHCLSMLSQKYYFYMAFENTIAEDYLTEKIFNLGKHSMIPIVYGGANYTELLPPNSFINARDYSPDQLAQLMRELMADKRRFNQYFRWKSDYVMEPNSLLASAFCQACSLAYVANLRNQTAPVYSLKSTQTINDWFFEPSKDSP